MTDVATTLHVGTSGFSYDEWKPAFYPEDLAKDRMLAFYAEQLPAVELNNTFYRMPKRAMVASWAAAVPDEFRFAVKASRRFTQSQKLRDCGELLGYLFGALDELDDKLGCVLYQLPKWFRKDAALLQAFLQEHPPGRQAAFEFLHDSWRDDEVVDVLAAHDAALVHSDRDDAPDAEPVSTGSWGYLRLRRAGYDDAALRGWRDRIEAQGWQRCFVFFKHEDSGAGPQLARRLLEA